MAACSQIVGRSQIAVLEFREHPLRSEHDGTYAKGLVSMLSKHALTLCRLWVCSEASVISTVMFQALGITESQETKMYFIFSPCG